MDMDPFKQYLKETESSKRDKGHAWRAAIGLQAVDGLNTSEYLTQTAVRNIEGEITFEEADELLRSYYEENPTSDSSDRTEEADRVSVRIAELLSERSFSFTPEGYISIHRKLFDGIYPHAGRIRDYNITKKEWVLDGDTVLYCSARELRPTLEYDLSEERKFSYRNLSMDEIIQHLAFFVSRLWQIHVFSEGNTRTTAVFFIKYLRMLGFDVSNDIFAENAWYFRNSLVRANYNDLKKGIHGTTEYLETFLRNLLLDEGLPMHNRTLHISGMFQEEEKANIDREKANIGHEKANIGHEKANIGHEKANIDREKANIGHEKSNIDGLFSVKTALHVRKLSESLGHQEAFGRSDVQTVLGLKPTRCSELLHELLENGIIEPVTGQGKGKYRFRELLG